MSCIVISLLQGAYSKLELAVRPLGTKLARLAAINFFSVYCLVYVLLRQYGNGVPMGYKIVITRTRDVWYLLLIARHFERRENLRASAE